MAHNLIRVPSILETALSHPHFSTLCQICQRAGIAPTLKDGGPYTFFAPTNEAFLRLEKGALDNLLRPENKVDLITLLTYHIIPSRLPSNTFKVGKIRTLSGKRCELGRRHGRLCIDHAEIIHCDLECSNGCIHTIDRVMLPEIT
jgi:uncharacterized surface protein with fasciclin (FAS1) repeats